MHRIRSWNTPGVFGARRQRNDLQNRAVALSLLGSQRGPFASSGAPRVSLVEDGRPCLEPISHCFCEPLLSQEGRSIRLASEASPYEVDRHPSNQACVPIATAVLLRRQRRCPMGSDRREGSLLRRFSTTPTGSAGIGNMSNSSGGLGDGRPTSGSTARSYSAVPTSLPPLLLTFDLVTVVQVVTSGVLIESPRLNSLYSLTSTLDNSHAPSLIICEIEHPVR